MLLLLLLLLLPSSRHPRHRRYGEQHASASASRLRSSGCALRLRDPGARGCGGEPARAAADVVGAERGGAGGCGERAHAGGEVGGERDVVAGQGGALEYGRLEGKLRLGADGGGVIVEEVVDDVHDAVGEEDVLLHDAGGVDEKRVGRHGDGEAGALARPQRGAVDEVGAVTDKGAAVDDVVIEDVGQLGHGHFAEGGAEPCEGVVGGREDGKVALCVEVCV